MTQVSVIVPAYNCEDTIGECLRSLEDQDYMKGYEIIMVDDGSTDSTPIVAKRFRKARILKQKNSGPARARNAGARAAKGDILLFTDSDCIAQRSWISEMVRPLQSDKTGRLVGVQGRYMTRQRGIVPRFIQAEIEQRYEVMERARYIDFVGSYSAAYRRKEYLRFGGFDESFRAASGEDPELSFRMAREGYRMAFAPKAVIYHTHPSTLWKYLRSRYTRGYWGRLLYKLHPEKRKDASSKSNSFFAGVVLTCLLSLAFIATLPLSPFYSAVALLLLAGTVLYESAWFMARHRSLALAAPFIIFLRNLFLGAGIVVGMARLR